MPDLLSSPLPVGYTGDITADQFNRLREDLFKIHDHSSGYGNAVAHSDLTDEILPGTFLNHEYLNQHVQGSGTSSAPDNPGGSAGVHGLASTQYVLGIRPHQLLWQYGTGTTNRWDDLYQQRGRGTFPVAYAEAPLVWCCSILDSTVATVYQRLPTSFAVRFRYYYSSAYFSVETATDFNWIVTGVSVQFDRRVLSCCLLYTSDAADECVNV